MEFEAYRLIQYSTGEGVHFGSQSSALNFAAAPYTGDIFRKIAVVHFTELHRDTIKNIVSKHPMGLLVILPTEIDRKTQSKQLQVWEDIQNTLTVDAVAIPVYFAYETQALRDYYAEMKASEAKAGPGPVAPKKGFRRLLGSDKPDYMMVLNTADPKVLSSINVDVFYGQVNYKH